jgi:hypothetical protein
MATTKPNGDSRPGPCDTPRGPRIRESSLFRLFLGGTIATVALALIVFVVEPRITGRESIFSGIVGADIRSPHGVGLIAFHFFNGSVIFPLGFAFLSARLPGPWLVKGLTWGAILWLVTEMVIMPISGYGFFGRDVGGPSTAVGALAGLLIYGGLQGFIAGLPGRKDE